jgi:5-methylthioadenosine/S-adenosylhomocysteine deaminase
MGLVSATPEKTKATLLIRHAHLLTMDAEHKVIADGALVIINDRIAAIGTTSELATAYTAEQEIDASGCIVIPGLINAHTHIPMSWFKGLADDLPLDKWLNDYIWPLEKSFIADQPASASGFIRDATLHGAAELIRNGITLANDMYFDGAAMAEAFTTAGVRCIIGEPLIENGKQTNLQDIGRLALTLKEQYKDNSLLDFSLAPHAIYTNPQKVLERCAEVALEQDMPVHIHISEAEWEVADCQTKHGKKPVEYLRDIGLLGVKIILAHGIHVSEGEMDILAENNASIAICTESNLKLANGFAPIKGYLDKGVNLCFGTDGVASNNNLDLLSELDFTAKLHKCLNHDPTFLPAEQMLEMATSGAAKALHKDRELGSLETGKLADLTILDCNSIEAQPLFNPYSQVIYALGGRAVRDVIINGKIVMRNKQFITLDEQELLDKARHYRDLIRRELRK